MKEEGRGEKKNISQLKTIKKKKLSHALFTWDLMQEWADALAWLH